jgi:hypothetical protein
MRKMRKTQTFNSVAQEFDQLPPVSIPDQTRKLIRFEHHYAEAETRGGKNFNREAR